MSWMGRRLVERTTEISFERLWAGWRWRAIPNCPGRFVLEGGRSDSSPQDILGNGITIVEYCSRAARDRILVANFDGGGLISYVKPDGRCIHTLNTPEGFIRKLETLGIAYDTK